jgi:hypothetical protein
MMLHHNYTLSIFDYQPTLVLKRKHQRVRVVDYRVGGDDDDKD